MKFTNLVEVEFLRIKGNYNLDVHNDTHLRK